MLEEHVTRALARIHTDAICGEGRRLGMDGCDAVSAEYSSEGTRVGRGGVRGGLGAGAPLVMMALVAAGTLNSSAANCRPR